MHGISDTVERPANSMKPDSPVTVSGDVSDAAWNEFVRAHHDATGYHLWEWRRVFEDGLGHRTHYLAAVDSSGVVGVLPLVEVRSVLFGAALSSLPYVNYGGILASRAEARDALLRAASDLAAARSLSYVVLRHRERMFDELPVRTHKVTMLLTLKADEKAMWDALDRKVRNQVRKAEKSAVTTRSGGIELLDQFYPVFARNMRDLGTPVYGRSLFRAILTAFPEDARLHLAEVSGRTVAGALSYRYGDVVEVPSASSLRDFRALCPNYILYWTIIKNAIQDGVRIFDFGRSTPDDGTYHFKEQWGAQPTSLSWEYALREGAAMPTQDRQSPRFRARIEMWKRLPVPVSTLLGPRIARSIP
jgi:FemAB-related protein (PEP-CTERM system-associated)